eukprot:g17179.t1
MASRLQPSDHDTTTSENHHDLGQLPRAQSSSPKTATQRFRQVVEDAAVLAAPLHSHYIRDPQHNPFSTLAVDFPEHAEDDESQSTASTGAGGIGGGGAGAVAGIGGSGGAAGVGNVPAAGPVEPGAVLNHTAGVQPPNGWGAGGA